MQDRSNQEAIARRAYEIWEAEGRPEGHDKHHWAQAESESRAPSADDLTYSEMEQPGSGHPQGDSGLAEASAQAGEGNPDPSSDEAGQRVQVSDDDESEALLQDGEPAGRPGRGIYAGP